MSWFSRSTQDHPAPSAMPSLGLRRSYVLPSEMHSPEKLASRPPAIKVSGNPPTDSDARRIMPRVLSPRRAQAVAVISSPARARVVLIVILLWFRGGESQEWGGGHSHSQPLHACAHGAQPSSTAEIGAKGPLCCGEGTPGWPMAAVQLLAAICPTSGQWLSRGICPSWGPMTCFQKAFGGARTHPGLSARGAEQSERGLNIEEPHCPHHRQQLKHCKRVGTHTPTHTPRDPAKDPHLGSPAGPRGLFGLA